MSCVARDDTTGVLIGSSGSRGEIVETSMVEKVLVDGSKTPKLLAELGMNKNLPVGSQYTTMVLAVRRDDGRETQARKEREREREGQS